DHYISVVTSSPAYQQVQEALASVASYLGINKGDAAAAAGISTTAATAMVTSNGRGGASRWAALNTPETRRLLLSLAGTGLSVLVAWLVLRRLLSELADPASKDHAAAKQAAARILRAIGADPSVRLTDYELVLAADLVDPAGLDATWADIGGLDEAIAELRESVVLPLRHPRLAERSRLLQPPKGVLLYGPPGCGKTLIAKATAKAAGARFLNVRLSSLFDKWVGESEKRVEALFSLAQKLQPVIVFVDELDSFLGNRDRMGGGHECSEKVKTQFMTFWDGLLTRSDSRVVVMAPQIGATQWTLQSCADCPARFESACRTRRSASAFSRCCWPANRSAATLPPVSIESPRPRPDCPVATCASSAGWPLSAGSDASWPRLKATPTPLLKPPFLSTPSGWTTSWLRLNVFESLPALATSARPRPLSM
ncbi:hypothetical protein BOX15_Mlig000914g3, partial [Macrostomum lignano]